jgi:hypothetical protein
MSKRRKIKAEMNKFIRDEIRQEERSKAAAAAALESSKAAAAALESSKVGTLESSSAGTLESLSRKSSTIMNEDEERIKNLKTEIKTSSTTSSSNQRKRRSTVIASRSGGVSVDDEEEERNLAELRPLNQFVAGCSSYHIEIPTIELKQQQSIKWDRVPIETTKGLAKAAARVLLMRGGRSDKTTPEHIRAALGDYKVHLRPAIKAAQQLLRQTFGYDVVMTKDPDNLYVVNTLKFELLCELDLLDI